MYILLLIFSLFLLQIQSAARGHHQSSAGDPIIVEPIGNACGPNSFLDYVGEFQIDWGGPPLPADSFHLINIYSLIDPQSGTQEKQIALQFVAGPLPATLSGTMSGQAPYGARLYQASYGVTDSGNYQVQELLYNNKKNGEPFAFLTDVGRPDEGDPFIAFAGVETAYPVQEHGSFANEFWDYTITCAQASVSEPARWVFNAYAPTAQSGGTGHDFIVKTYIEGVSWQQQIVGIQGPLDYMFYTNVMIPSGGEYNLDGYLTADQIEIIAADIDNTVIHSSAGDPWGSFDSGGINEYSPDRFNEAARVEAVNWSQPNQYNGPNGPGVTKPPTWVGWFVKNDRSYNDAFQNRLYDLSARNVTENMQLRISSEQGYYPKLFCGPTLTISWSDDKLAYCELWFSPNAPSFWHGPSGLADFDGFTLTFTPTRLDGINNLPFKTYLPLILK